jgi:polynucleotide 5'-hydroxyl-kinase GRC3/NOL9
MAKAWRKAVGAVLDLPGAVVMLGAVDVGKTTAATRLANEAVRAGRRTAVVDLDMGQAALGPPATAALGRPDHPVRRMSEIPLERACFVGDTSPRGTYRFVLDGTVRLIGEAWARAAQVVIVDTTGWVSGPAAVAAKVAKIRRIGPLHIFAIQRAGEVEPILERIPASVVVHRFRPSSRARLRSSAERRAYREQRFGRYFAHARVLKIDLGRVSGERTVWYAGRRIPPVRVLAEVPPHALRHLLVGLAGRDGWMRALGTVAHAFPSANRMDVLAPLGSLAGVRRLQWGTLRVAPSGREEGRPAQALGRQR